MHNSNYNLWAKIPGETNTFVVRNFTFYQLKNQDEFLFFNQKPKVQETEVISYQEFQEFRNANFLENQALVQYDFHRHFNNLTDSSILINDVLNVGSFGAWHKMKNANETLLSLNGLSILFKSLVQQTVPVIIAIGYTGLNKDETYNYYCKIAQLNDQMCNWLKTDSIYGWKDNLTLIHWSQATLSNSTFSGESLYLKDYFKLSNDQFNSLYNSFSETTNALMSFAVDSYCNQYIPQNLTQNVTCRNDPFSLAAVQWSIGQISKNPPYPIKPFETNPKASFVFWNYMKYFVYNFTQNIPLGGTPGQASIGQFTADSLQKNYQQMKNNIQLKLFAGYFFKKILLEQKAQCNDVFSFNFSIEQVQKICQEMEDFKNWDFNSMFNLAYLCIKQDPFYTEFFIQKSLSEFQQYVIFCKENQYIGQNIIIFNQILFDKYNCSPLSGKGKICSDNELAQQQWYGSVITLNLPEQISDILSKGESYYFWDKENIDGPFEYQYFINNIIKEEKQNLNNEQINKLLTYDVLFSPSVIPQIFQLQKLKNKQLINQKFYFQDGGDQLCKYYRYLMVNLVFKSLKQTRKASDLLFGYVDYFVDSQKNKDPQTGGDPSLNSTIILNDPNNNYYENTSKIIMYTGQSDSSKTRQYYSINGFNYTTYQFYWFDGKNVQSVYTSPWNGNAYIQGSDSVQNPPNIDYSDKVYVYIDSFDRGGAAVWNGQKQKHGGLECYRYQNEDKFYQNKNSRISNSTEILDIQGNKVVSNKEKDGLFMDIEPYSGITLAAAINVQVNMLIEPDELFDIKQPVLIPIYNTFRTGNWSDSAIDNQLGELKMALVAKRSIEISGYIIGGVFIVLSLILLYRIKKIKNIEYEQQNKNNQLLEDKEQIVSDNYI
ncbi:hypothetical protein IMG5_140280 [Ichthyophthirius multifiliis]|uniref:Uncharacterized protein n=1 Tax=Ichthyophthirius multifiliis TaxID=5932 RepID=G0QXA8_ICHMU|nr:hypothetical protein IMG5_140280 [Ichthyophthirius multifiliis]EGR30149.1 hypothetical protein IMG5_140280 [Ichthyophthirius multifiliis]|eukprot:XP_004031385.1 hypothetical protein IMG5_140280 [Ichthyophthirius multifiliis]